MSHQPTEHDGRRALRDHLLEKADAARARHGPTIDDAGIMRLLDDRDFVRYQTGVRFDAAALEPGEFAHAMPLGEHPREGFCLFIHPLFEPQRELWPLLIAYFIPPINYGDIAAPEDCEQFGAALLGFNVEDYYGILCDAADLVSPPQAPIGSDS
jgi:hypothetical protein